MNTIIVALFAAMASVSAEANVPPTPIAILSQSQDIGPDGNFSSQFETANGISEEFKGSIKKIGDEEIQVIVGSFSWTDPNGTVRKLTYIADENGYQPQADFLPVAPAVPLPIQLALRSAAADSEAVPRTLIAEADEKTVTTVKTETTEKTETIEKTETAEKTETTEKTEAAEKTEVTEAAKTTAVPAEA